MFKIGQKVVCNRLNSVDNRMPYGLQKDKVYEIERIFNCSCGKEVLELVGMYGKYMTQCPCGYEQRRAYYYSYRFEPLKYELISNTEFIKEVVTEKLDLPIKEPVLN